MIPGMSGLMGGDTEAEASKRMKRIAFIFDSMTTAELDSDGSVFRDPPKAPKDKGKGKVAVAGGAAAGGAGGKGKAVAAPASSSKGAAPDSDDSDDDDAAAGADVDPLGGREPNARVLRVARGSGTSVEEVEQLLAQHQMFSKMAKRMGGKNGMCVVLSLALSLSPSLLPSHPSSARSLPLARSRRSPPADQY